MSFADEIAVTRVGPGSFAAEMHERWSSLVGIMAATRPPSWPTP